MVLGTQYFHNPFHRTRQNVCHIYILPGGPSITQFLPGGPFNIEPWLFEKAPTAWAAQEFLKKVKGVRRWEWHSNSYCPNDCGQWEIQAHLLIHLDLQCLPVLADQSSLVKRHWRLLQCINWGWSSIAGHVAGDDEDQLMVMMSCSWRYDNGDGV